MRGPDELIFGTRHEELEAVEEVVPALLTRAMLHAGESRPREAWRDVHASLRLGRMLASPRRGSFAESHSTSISICDQAGIAALELLATSELSAADASTIRRDLEDLPPVDATSALVGARLGALDWIVRLAGADVAAKATLLHCPESELPWWFRVSLDWNEVLRALSDRHDRIEAAMRLPTRRETEAELDRMRETDNAAMSRRTEWRGTTRLLRIGTSRSARSADVAAIFSWHSSRVVDAGRDVEQAAARLELVRMAAALAEHRLRGLGGPDRPYPERLDALVPDVLSALPCDPFTGGPLQYAHREDGYVLYSVGVDGADDGGSDESDIVVRMPRPARGILPPRSGATRDGESSLP